jgi:hypothetical protein
LFTFCACVLLYPIHKRLCILQTERLEQEKNALSDSSGSDICCVMRTYKAQARQLPLAVESLYVAADHGNVSIRIFVMNTDPQDFEDVAFIKDTIAHASVVAPRSSRAEILTFPSAPWKGFYGYDYTQYAMEHILENLNEKACKYILFTNGDNLFGVNLFLLAFPSMQKQVDIVAWRFVSRYLRLDNGGEKKKFTHQAVNTKFELYHIDLSSAIFKAKTLQMFKPSFIPDGNQTKQTTLRDWKFIEQLLERNVSHTILPHVLFLHQ